MLSTLLSWFSRNNILGGKFIFTDNFIAGLQHIFFPKKFVKYVKKNHSDRTPLHGCFVRYHDDFDIYRQSSFFTWIVIYSVSLFQAYMSHLFMRHASFCLVFLQKAGQVSELLKLINCLSNFCKSFRYLQDIEKMHSKHWKKKGLSINTH